MPVCLSVCLFDCLSVRPSHGGIVPKRLNISWNIFSPSSIHNILEFFNVMAIFRIRWGPPGAWNAVGYENRDFRPISRFVSKMIQNRVILTMAIAYRKSYNNVYRMTPPLTEIARSRHYLNAERYERQTPLQRNSNTDLHMPSSRVSFRMTLIELSGIFNDTKHGAVSLRQRLSATQRSFGCFVGTFWWEFCRECRMYFVDGWS